jgi:sulfoacetaldehyde dehydrogenase
VILATGGSGMVKAAYSSGKPAQGVGAGNAVCIIDETADLKDAADKIMRSKTFDHATSCSTENSICIQEGVYDQAIKELEAVGGYVVNADEKKRLQETMWENHPEQEHCRPIRPEDRETRKDQYARDKTFILVPETGVGKDYPFSGEKLSPVAAVYKWKEFPEAIDLVNRITTYSGPGHSCGIHTTNDSRVIELGLRVKVTRIMIRQPQCLANSGAWTNGMPMSMTLGCGSWGGNATAANITWEHLLNYTWVSYPIPSTQPTDLELFGNIMYEA